MEDDLGGAEAVVFGGGGVAKLVEQDAEEEDWGPHQLVEEDLGAVHPHEDEDGHEDEEEWGDADLVSANISELPALLSRCLIKNHEKSEKVVGNLR